MGRQYEQVDFRGAPVTARQKQAILAAEARIRARYWGFRFVVFQGSWQPRTDYSGTSHTGAGVCDLGYEKMGYGTRLQRIKYGWVLKVLRETGHQAAFGRGPWNQMPYHYHVCDLDTTGQADTVRDFQVPEYRAKNDGLVAGRDDPFQFRPHPMSAFDWRDR
jgi:hypothetical protein